MFNQFYIQQFKTYEKYFGNRQDELLNEIKQDLEYFKKDELTESIYNQEDVSRLFDDFHKIIYKNILNTLQKNTLLQQTYIQTLFQQLQQNNLNVEVDLTYLEINAQKFQNSLVNELQTSQFVKPNKINARLSNISAPVAYNNDPELTNEINSLKKDLENLKIKNQKFQNDIIQINQENKKINQEAQNIKQQSQFGQEKESEFENSLKSKDQKIQELSQQVEKQNEDLQKKINESAQFNNLKKMIQQKNDQIKELKEKLSKFE